MSKFRLPARRAAALTAASALSLGLLTSFATSVAAAPDDGTVASGSDWSVTQAAGGYEVTLELDEPLPVVDDAPTLTVDGVVLGIATESVDGLSLSVVTSDPAVADADDVALAWASGDDAKVEPSDSPVTSKDEPVEPSDLSKADLQSVLAAGDDGSTPGPYSYKQDDYDYGDQALDSTGLGGIRQELTGRVYLTTATGERPTVILLHGRHSSCATVVTGTTNPNRWPCVTGQTEIPSYKGYDGTGQTLATWGYNVVSISANAINANDNQLAVDNGALARGQLVIDSLKMIAKWNAGDPSVYHDNALNTDYTVDQALDAPQADVGTTDLNALNGTDLVGKFDLDNVGLMGHSRGGEGVTSAVNLNQALAQPFGIKSVLPLAPVDFTRMTVGHTPMLVMLPYCDGDVSNQQGQHFIDDSRYAYDDSVLLSTVWVMGANHNFFNTVWTPGKYAYSTSDDWGATSTDSVCGPRGNGNIRLTADQQYNVGTAIMSSWFRMTVPPVETGFLPKFDGSTPKPTLASVPNADIRVLGNAPADERVDIERFTEFNGNVRIFGTGTATVCASAGGRTVAQPMPPCATANTVRSTSAMPHWTPASYAPNVPASPMTKFVWTSNTGAIRISVPTAARNAAAHDMLIFKTAPEESVVTGTDMTVSVVDSAGATWSSLVSALNPLAIRRMPASGSTTLNKIVLQQVSIPVSSMTGINTADIREVRFTAGSGADATANGGVYLSDLALADSSIGVADVLTSAPTINVDATNVEEGNAASDTKSIAVVLDKPSTQATSGWLTLIGSTATTAKAGLVAKEVVFAPGETCKAVEVPTFGDTAKSSTPTTSYKSEVSWQKNVVYGAKAFGTINVREDDGLTGTATPVPAVGVQGDVCAEYAAKSKVFALTATDAEPAPGETVTVTGSGFRNGEGVTFTDSSTTPATVLGTAVASAAGTVSQDIAFPADAVLGTRTITAVGAGSSRTATAAIGVRTPTTTTLALSRSSTSYGDGASGTVSVTGATGGTVKLTIGGASSLLPVDGAGIATFSVPAGADPGSYPITASYLGSDTVAASSTSAGYTVGKADPAPSITVLKADQNGKKTKISLRVNVYAVPAGVKPTGIVTVTWGKTSKTVNLPASGQAIVNFTKKKGKAPETVRAVYSGDDYYVVSQINEDVF